MSTRALVLLAAFAALFYVTLGPAATKPTYADIPTGDELEKLVDDAVAHRKANLFTDKTPDAQMKKEIKKELIDTETFCAGQHSTHAYDFCSMTTGYGVLREWAEFKAGAAAATWEEEKHFQIRYMKYNKAADYFPPNNPTRWKQVVDALNNQDGPWGTFNHTRQQAGSELSSDGVMHAGKELPPAQQHAKGQKTRKRTSFKGSRGTWHVERVGPFYHNGGDEWHHLWFDSFRDLVAPAPSHFGRFLVGSLMAIMTPEGEIIGYPPAHMHHFHLYNTNANLPFSPWRHFLGTETHGDASCTHKGIGAICYMQQWPEGFAWPLAEDYFFDSLVNFVVPPRNKKGDEFWYQAAIYEADAPPSVGMPLPVFSGIDDFNPLQQPEAHTFRIPKTGHHANWESLEVEFDAEVIGEKVHSHWYFTTDFWVIEATPEELGLNKAPFVLTDVPCTPGHEWPYDTKPAKTSDQDDDGKHTVHCDNTDSPIPATMKLGELLALEKTGMDIEEFQSYILKNLAEHRAKTGKRAGILFKSGDPNKFQTTIDGTPYWYRSRNYPGFTDLHGGSILTAIGFYKDTTGMATPKALAPGDKAAAPDAMASMADNPVRMHLKKVTFARPKSALIRWIMSGTSSNTIRWYKNHKPAVFGAVALPCLLLFGFLVMKLCKKMRAPPSRPALYNTMGMETAEGGVFNASNEDRRFAASGTKPL